MKPTRSTTTLLVAVMAAAALAACSKTDDSKTAGEKLDQAIASTERAASEARSDVGAATADAKAGLQSAASDAKAATEQAATAVATTARDIAITAQIKTELAKDGALSALRIDVDTREGRVSLSGTAPSAAASERATQLAQAVDGVLAVDNRLVVETKS